MQIIKSTIRLLIMETNFNITKRFMNIPELAKYLAMSQDAIRNWVKRGEIPFSRFGRSIRFDMRKIETWLKNKEAKIAFEA